MWLITYHVIPKPESPEFKKSGGAYVNCWILFAWQDGAEHLARFEVEKECTIVETEDVSWYDPGDINDDSPYKEYYDQAMVDGGCFVFNYYPLESSHHDEDFDLETTDNRVLKTEH